VVGGLISRRINAERLMLLGWSRAILLQLAHPLIAAGVAEHSSFRAGALTAIVRLHETIRSMLALTFGDEQAWHDTIDKIRGIHRRVNGRLREGAGRFPSGTAYSAEDPELVLWVHATLLDSIPLVYERIVGPLTDVERDAYCDEAAAVALALGARAHEIPRTWSVLRTYLDATYASGAIAVSSEARELAAVVLSPPIGWAVAPLSWSNRLMGVGLLPDHVRADYGFRWNAARERRLQLTLSAIQIARSIMPSRFALWPQAR
jgi:uncharacterized protein (DUF2236 family)